MQLHTFLKYLTSLYKERVWSRKSIATISNLAYFVFWRSFVEERIYRVIHKTLLDFSPLRYSSREGHAEEEHVNRGRDTPIFCPTLQVLDIGDAADVNPVITFLPHMYNVCVAGTWLQDWHLSLHQGWTYRVPVSWDKNFECLSLCWHAHLRRDHPGYCTAEVGNPGGTYELPCIRNVRRY